MKRKVLAGLCALGLVCSCSKDEAVAPDGALGGVSVEVMFSGPRVDDAWSDSTGTATRATNSTWTANDEVGLYMLPVSATTLADAIGMNRQYRYSSGNFSAVDYPLYYPVNGSTVNFAAYYPYDASAVTNGNKTTIDFTDQSTRINKEKRDLCFHRSLGPYSKTNQAASMSFQHKFSKIRMTVNQGTSGLNLNTLTGVTLKGMPASATVRLADLAALPSTANESQVVSTLGITGTTDITAYIDPATKTSTQAIAEAIIAPHTVGADKKIEFTIGSETKTYTFDPAFTFESGKRYDFVFTLQASGPEPDPQPETTSVDGMTNCYMVIPGEDVTFEVSRAYEYDGTDFTNRLRVANTADYTDGFVAKVIWQDPSDLIVSPTSTPSADAMFGTGNTAKVTVQTNNKSGNALVGIYKSTDTSTPVWSYHIWVTDYVPEVGVNTATNNGFVFMNRNLGATAAGTSLAARGLFYQWGRKDPFPGTKAGTAGYAARAQFKGINDTDFTSTTPVTVTGTDNAACIIQSIQNPTTFFTQCNANNYDWLKLAQNDLWYIHENNKEYKTIYDPCPPGWRVPYHIGNTISNNNTPWKGYTGSYTGAGDTAGWNFGDNAIYPMCGYRHANGGYSNGGGTHTYLFTSTRNESGRAAILRATSDYQPITNGLDAPAAGFSIRCVQE
jgi:hypothetical protein